MTRTPKEIFKHHAETLVAGDLEGVVSDYAEDAVFISPAGVKRGKAGVREAFAQLLSELPDAKWALPSQIYDGDALFLEWTAKSKENQVEDGVDTFLFKDGFIRLQTVRYTLKKV